jgi:DNA-binding transcriptional LysR family regulator
MSMDRSGNGAHRTRNAASVADNVRPLRDPQLDELLTFCTAADLGSLGRAAQRLHLTQPAVSRRLKSLETLVGVPLLERSAQGVSMTMTGERVYAHARRLLTGMQDLNAALAQIRGATPTVRLAISHTAAEFLMPRALVLMRRQTSAPVEVLIANSRVVKEMVLSAQIDVGVAACMSEEAVPDVVNIVLTGDEIVLAVPLGHPWARCRSISPRELLSTPIVLRDPGAHTRHVIGETLDEHRLGTLQAACEVGSTQAAKDEAHELGCPALMSRLALSPADRLEIVPVAGLRFRRRFCILHPHGSLTQDGAHLIEAFQASGPAHT